MKKILIVLIVYCFITLNAQVFTAGSFKNRIYLLDGLAMRLTVYNRDTVPVQKISLKNISKNSVFDFFLPYDDFNIYLSDSFRDIIYLLDENFALKKSIDVKKEHGTEIYRKIFPFRYDGLIIASKNMREVFELRNNRMKKIINTETEFEDIFADKDFIYLLFKNSISVYSFTGIFIKRTAVPEIPDYSDFIVNDSRIYLKSKSGITSFNPLIREFSELELAGNSVFTAIDSTLYIFSGDSLKLMRIDL
ncbi:MAG: hypothetical protein JXN63_01315 [Candidatus Delongbacteria bacterium]|nr:hypothetical protein [Candidatus Delongbacteria bacterium]